MPPPRAAALLAHPPHATMRAPSPNSISNPASRRPQAPPTSLRPHVHIRLKTDACARFFSTTTARLVAPGEPNHYEILDVPTTATAGEIKKQFYALSLRHHPDRNRDDPNASQRFARISAAYNVLGNASKRASYDREYGFHRLPHPGRAGGGGAHQHPMGSHSSYSANLHNQDGSYAGSRPASGLSKRRGPFRGPPPSFYAQGGYGTTGRTGSSAGDHSSSSSKGGGGGFETGFGVGGRGKGNAGKETDPEDPTAFIDRNPLGHFNARGHFRTQTAEDMRRRERRSRAMRAAVADEVSGGGTASDFLLRFLVACGSLVIAVSMSGLFKWHSPSPSPTATSPPPTAPSPTNTTTTSKSTPASARAGGMSEGKTAKQRPQEVMSGSSA